MGRTRIDRTTVKAMYDEGGTVTEIAKKLGCTKGAVSKVLKEMGIHVSKAAVAHAPKYADRRDAASEHLMELVRRAKYELDWIEDSVPPTTGAEYREWQNQKLKFAAEMRKLIGSMADIGYKLFQATEVAEVIKIIDEEIGNESPGCQQRIRERLQARRDYRFPLQVDN